MASLFYYRIIEKLEFKDKINKKGQLFLQETINQVIQVQNLQQHQNFIRLGIDTKYSINLLKRKILEILHLSMRLSNLCELFLRHIEEIQNLYKFLVEKVDKLGYEILKKEFLEDESKIEKLVWLVCNKDLILDQLQKEHRLCVDTKDRLFNHVKFWTDFEEYPICGKNTEGLGSIEPIQEISCIVNKNIGDFQTEAKYIHHLWIYQDSVIPEFFSI